MIKRLFWLPILMISSAAAMGCASNPEEDSCNIKTAGIYVEYDAIEEGGGTTAEATFWVGNKPGGTFLTLGDCGDTVTVNGQSLSHTSGSDHDWYEANLAPADAYTFVFTRDGEDPYTSTVTPPPTVTVTAPSGTSISRADAFDLAWTANGSGQVDLLISGDCIKDYPSVNGESIADTGSYTVNAGDIEPFVSSDADKTCGADVRLERGANGSMAPGLEGTVRAYSRGHTSFTSTP